MSLLAERLSIWWLVVVAEVHRLMEALAAEVVRVDIAPRLWESPAVVALPQSP